MSASILAVVLVCMVSLSATYGQSTTPSSSTTTVRLDPTLPPDVCREENTFELPNGQVVDNFEKFCTCPPARWTAEQFLNSNPGPVFDFLVPHCNADGTWNCVQVGLGVFCADQYGAFVGIPPSPNCSVGAYCDSACISYGLGRSNLMTGFQNTGNCSCVTAFNQQTDPKLTAASNFVPQCNVEGSWKSIQSGYGLTWSVDINGNQITAAKSSAGGLY